MIPLHAKTAVIASLAFLLSGCAQLKPGGKGGTLPNPDSEIRCPGHDLAGIRTNRLLTFRLDNDPKGHGTAIVISKEGHLLTAYHVVDGAKSLSITILESDGQVVRYPATVVGKDERHDLALIKIDRGFSRAAKLVSHRCLDPGDPVYNIGYPHSIGQMVSSGRINRLNWNWEFKGGITIHDGSVIDVMDGPGTSGSAVFCAVTGGIVGILTNKVWFGSGRMPATIMVVMQSTKYIKSLLDSANVPYETLETCRERPAE